jgi:5'-nucleotidase/2',3'-cyclic-nucleotide 2'-phosphodiesterase/3'-nucleotidase/5'-nucleotidase
VKGERIGIFGLTTAETREISSPEKITFSNYMEEAKKMVTQYEKMGINKIVAITHIGFDDNPAIDNDLELAKAVKGIDIIVGGHSHTALTKPVLIQEKTEPTVIVQAGQYGEYLGTLHVNFDQNGRIVQYNGKFIPIAEQKADPEAAKLLIKYSDQIKKVKDTPIGATAVELLDNPRTFGDDTKPSVRKNETLLGNVITDGMLANAKQFNPEVKMAFLNGGGIRAPINKGPISVGEVMEVLPLGYRLAMVKTTGAELRNVFERSVESYPREDSSFLQVSGAKIKYDSSKPAGKRVVSIQYFDGQKYIPIQDEKMYMVATNSFIAKGGDGFDIFKKINKEGRVTNLDLTDWQIFAEYLKKLDTVAPQVEERIVNVTETAKR